MTTWLPLVAGVLLLGEAAAKAAGPQPKESASRVDFVRDVQPIFRASCYSCHGPEKRQGKLRLDAKSVVLKGGDSGPALVAGNGKDSLLYKYLVNPDADERMPRKADPLSKAQIEIIRQWIDQGAEWPDSASVTVQTETHWSYVAPKRLPAPKVAGTSWVRNPIDAFVLARLEKEGLAPAAEATKEALIRRVSLDLTGLPPGVRDVDAFLADPSPQAYEKLVDRLLASPRYGERWARLWLDLARYADSNGYDEDSFRVMWKFRDWVIGAFNKDMPFDQFTIEQIAGDMIPGATIDQRIASGFHANTLLNAEGGVDGEEARFEVLVDRVNTTGQVWLGSTIGCAQCHNHKYDPFSQKDYYSMLAFFDNGVTDIDRRAGNNNVMKDPVVQVPTPAQEMALASLNHEMAKKRQLLSVDTPELQAASARWTNESRTLLDSWKTFDAPGARAEGGARFARQKDGSYLVSGPNPKTESYTITGRSGVDSARGLQIELLLDPSLPKVADGSGPGRGPNGGFVITELKVFAAPAGSSKFAPVAIDKAVADASVSGWEIDKTFDGKDDTGWSALGGKPHVAVLTFKQPVVGRGASFRISIENRSVHPQHAPGRFRLSVTPAEEPGKTLALPQKIRSLLLTPPQKVDEAGRSELAAHHRSIAPALDPVREEIARLKKKIDGLGVPTAIVVQERPSFERPSTALRVRGSFSNPGDRVYANVPAVLPRIAEDQPPNRLGLARWLVSRQNPLTARVSVNRFWEQLFGRGLVETSEDFGIQGSRPTHPELLDWLATEFMESGWRMKALLRLVVTSATYRQSSRVTPELVGKDPYNRLLARGPRFRVEAEMIRDVALHASGLLSSKVGGPSVFPVQPDGIWNVSRNSEKWVTSDGEDRYRRAIYTFLRRSAPYPMLTTFDATSREICTIRRVRTNTPLQALNLLNDPVFFDAARGLARRMVHEGGADPRGRAALGFRLCATRRPTNADLEDILSLYRQEKQRIEREGVAGKLLGASPGQTSSPATTNDLAAWTMVANVLLNLDETQTKE